MRLIVNGDDFGYTPGVTRGIATAHRHGIVTSTTLMVNAPDAEGAARVAREARDLDVGVHVVFTYGRPLLPASRVPSLVNADGAFPGVRELLREQRARTDDALAEARAQYARAAELIGRDPTHLDTHHWVHDVPAIEDAILALAKETGAAARSHDARQRDRFRNEGVRTTDRFVREYQHSGRIAVDALTALLGRLAHDDGTVELMCHPGEVDADLLARSAYAAERGVELATLTDPATRAAIEQLEIELIDFTDL